MCDVPWVQVGLFCWDHKITQMRYTHSGTIFEHLSHYEGIYIFFLQYNANVHKPKNPVRCLENVFGYRKIHSELWYPLRKIWTRAVHFYCGLCCGIICILILAMNTIWKKTFSIQCLNLSGRTSACISRLCYVRCMSAVFWVGM